MRTLRFDKSAGLPICTASLRAASGREAAEVAHRDVRHESLPLRQFKKGMRTLRCSTLDMIERKPAWTPSVRASCSFVVTLILVGSGIFLINRPQQQETA